jgi:hypothetical protein
LPRTTELARASLSRKPGSSTPIKDERQSTPLPETSTGGGFEIFDIDGFEGRSGTIQCLFRVLFYANLVIAHESREA